MKIRSTEVSHEVRTPARSGSRGISLFASAGGFPKKEPWGEAAARAVMHTRPTGRTIEQIRNPYIYTDMLGEVICNNLRVWRRKTEYVSEENDCLGSLCGITWRWGKVVGTDHGTLWFARDEETLVARCASHA